MEQLSGCHAGCDGTEDLDRGGWWQGGAGGTEKVAGLVKDLARAGHCIDWELILLIKSSWWHCKQ